MSVQISLFERVELKRSNLMARVDEVVGSEFDEKKFVENFEALVNVVGSTKHLKEMVLQLAVRGGLSGPTTDTADSLVAELHRARTRLATAGVRVRDLSPPVTDDEAPHGLPPGWRWVRLRDFGGFLGGGTPAKSNAAFWKGQLPWVSPKDMKRPYIEDAEDHISMAAVEGSAVKLIPGRSILYVVRGMILAHSFPVAVTTREVTINQDMKALVLAVPELSEFILRSCQAARRRVLAKVERSSHGTCRLESEWVEMLPIALPPLPEQKRIVAKVDQLMALCDDLEARQAEKREIGTRLTKSALEALTTADGPKEFDAAWKRVIENFSTIIDRADKVDEIRKAALELAIRGKLTRRVRTDEPADELLSRIVSRLGVSRKPFEPPAFPLPMGWCWARFPELGVFGRGKSKHRPRNAPKLFQNGKYPMVQTGDVARATGEIITHTAMYGEAGLAQSRLWPKGTLCITIAANIADSGLLGFDACFPDSVVGFVPDAELGDARYFEFFLRTAKRHIEDFAPATAQKNINLEILGAVLIPLPPKAEMVRIVAKVGQLMKICDDLESKLVRAEDRAAKLVEAVVQELVA